MTKTEFQELLELHNINETIVVFGDSVWDGYCIRKNHFRWEVFFKERGKEYNVIGFPSESDALIHLYEKLRDIYCKSSTEDGTVCD